jgi:hypothetical protein
MNRNRTDEPLDFDRVAAAWLIEGPNVLADRVLDAVRDEVHVTRQRVSHSVWGRISMLARGTRSFALAGVFAALITVGAIVFVGGRQPSTSPTPSATASPNPSASTSATASSGSLAPFGYTGGGTIEFTKHDASGKDALWVIDPSGLNPTLVASAGCCGLFSPDGSQLALAAPGVTLPSLTPDPSLLGIEVLDRPGTNVAFVVPTGCGACTVFGLNDEPDAWSPNGRYIALTMWSDTDDSQAGMGIADRDFPGIPWDWPQTRVTGAHADIPIAFSPDSSMLLFMRTERTVGPTAIGPLFVVGVTDLAVRQVSPPGVTVSTNGLIQGPASWSSDGQSIVFAGVDASVGTTSIFEVGIQDGAEARKIVADAPGATSARFSPDGTMIAFDRKASTAFHDLWVIQPDGTGATNLTSTFDPGVCCAQWSPDGKAMLVAGTTSDDSHNNLLVVAADGGGIWQVTDDLNVYTGFLWGPGFR